MHRSQRRLFASEFVVEVADISGIGLPLSMRFAFQKLKHVGHGQFGGNKEEVCACGIRHQSWYP
jgi:hypothetical protein